MKIAAIASVLLVAALAEGAFAASSTEKSCIAGCRRAGGDVNACIAANNCAQYRRKPASATQAAPQKPAESPAPRRTGDY